METPASADARIAACRMVSVSPAPGARRTLKYGASTVMFGPHDDGGSVMLAVSASLHDHGACWSGLVLTSVNVTPSAADSLDQRGDILGETGAAPLGIEVPHLRVQRQRSVPRSVRIVGAHRQVDERVVATALPPVPGDGAESPACSCRRAAGPPRAAFRRAPAAARPADIPRLPCQIPSIRVWAGGRDRRPGAPTCRYRWRRLEVRRPPADPGLAVVIAVPTLIAVVPRQQHLAVLDLLRGVQVVDLTAHHLRVA